ncbi:MAG: hypothetical protein MUF44_09670 [Hydrogenophaga sp.]|jgi:hypothetical protein|nr:hypothetical protein [Hydrogenophaga sp.]
MKAPLPLCTARVRHWLRLLLLCSVFSAVHGPLGAWVVSSVSEGSAVQICTPQGMQWVSVSSNDPEAEHQVAAFSPCVWASAHVAFSPPVGHGLVALAPGYLARVAGPDRSAPMADERSRRVLLMSAMRAPPPELR